MLYASGYVSPSPIVLAERDIIPAKVTDHIARLAREGFGAESGEPGAGHEALG